MRNHNDQNVDAVIEGNEDDEEKSDIRFHFWGFDNESDVEVDDNDEQDYDSS